MMDEKSLEIKEYNGEGYRPVIDYGSWRVAVLNYIDELLPQNIIKMQKHRETDEIFILLRGQCLLYIGEGGDEITRISSQKMEPFKMYNVKQNTWHTHTLSQDGMVLIVENRNTSNANSPEMALSGKQRQKLVDYAKAVGFQ